MVEALFNLSSERIAIMVAKSAARFVPSLSAASPALRPETLFTSEFELARMVLALLLDISIRVVLPIAAPVGAFHFGVLVLNNFLHGWLFLNLIRHVAGEFMALGVRGIVQHLVLGQLLFTCHLVRVAVQ